MRTVNIEDVEWFGEVGVRGTGADFKRLLNGDDLSADNFELNIAKVEDRYFTPRHRHNFDQVRYVLSGAFGFDKGRNQTAGTVGYFPEGCHYQQQAEGPSLTLLLQTAGASNAPYVSYPTLRRLVGELSAHGEFRKGVYSTIRADGTRVNQDSYEALWEKACNREITYPRPRYNDPIIMYPDAFEYAAVAGAPGVSRKHLGTFTERALGIGFLRFEAGAALEFDGGQAGDHLFHVISGTGRIGGHDWRPGDVLHLDTADHTGFTAATTTELYYLRLPTRLGTPVSR